MPNDSGGGRRSVYASHAYAVLAVNIASVAGAPPGFDIASYSPMIRPMMYQFVDVAASTVTLMNPHHGNAPDATGTASADPSSKDPVTGLTPSQSGQFTMGLERFFMLMGSVTSAEFNIPAY
jgi:hypothetical protein